jgi:hypothetical protein
LAELKAKAVCYESIITGEKTVNKA